VSLYLAGLSKNIVGFEERILFSSEMMRRSQEFLSL
jgi:hypothetical protein